MKKGIILIYFLFLNHASAQPIVTFAGTGVSGYSGDGGPATEANLFYPIALKGDGVGNLFFADSWNSVVRKISPSGIITTVAGTGVAGYSGDGGPAISAQLDFPVDIVFDNAGNLYVSDAGSGTIRKINSSGTISTIAGIGLRGFSGIGGAATDAQLSDPFGMIFDKYGDLVFSDGAQHCIHKINEAGVISTIAGTGTSGFSGDGGPATAAMVSVPSYLALNKYGEILVPDWQNHRLRKIDTFGVISTIAGNGIAANTGDGGDCLAASIHSPSAVVFDDSDNMIISSVLGCSIRRINNHGIISTIAGTGVCGYSGDGGPAIAAQFRRDALCTYIDAGGNLYITDRFNHRIRRINYNTSAVVEVTNNRLNVTIFPNPASNEITISANDNIKTMVIVNMLGQVVIETNYNKKQMVKDIRFLSPGLYTVKVNNAYAGRFVKE